jgi:hypothetical protein
MRRLKFEMLASLTCTSTGCGTFLGSGCFCAIGVGAIRENQRLDGRSSRCATGRSDALEPSQYDAYAHAGFSQNGADGAIFVKIFAIVCCDGYSTWS